MVKTERELREDIVQIGEKLQRSKTGDDRSYVTPSELIGLVDNAPRARGLS